MSKSQNKTQSHSQNNKKENIAQSQPIMGFEGYFSYMSNDYPAWVNLQGILFPSVSTAFQAARTDDQKIRQKIANVTDTQQFRNIAMSIKNPPDWAEKKQKVMKNLIRDKFKRNKQIQQKLMSTKDKILVNVLKNGGFNQEFWGVFEDRGKNVLGKILMSIRQEYIKGNDTKNWIQNNLNLQVDQNMFPVVEFLVLKGGKKVDKINLDKNKNYYLFGSLKTVDFHLENPTISRNHACLYFSDLQVMIVDLKSTHGTFIKRKGQTQKRQLQGLVGYRLYKDDVLQFGTSERQYVIDINRSQIQKYINNQEQTLRQNKKQHQKNRQNLQQYSQLSRQEVRNKIGIENKCILIENLSYKDNYSKIKQQFNKYEKVKNVRFKINNKTGRNQDIAVVYFQSTNAVTSILSKAKQIPYKMSRISQKDAEIVLNIQKQLKKGRSRSRSNEKKKSRSRSREKKPQNNHRQ